MVDIKMNYYAKYTEDLWRCDSCLSAIETQSHVLYCPAYTELRKGKNLESNEDLTEYFKKVLKIREELNLLK